MPNSVASPSPTSPRAELGPRRTSWACPALARPLLNLYEVASAFPTGNRVGGLYDWIGLWTFKDLVGDLGGDYNASLAVYGDLVLVLGERFDLHDVRTASHAVRTSWSRYNHLFSVKTDSVADFS